MGRFSFFPTANPGAPLAPLVAAAAALLLFLAASESLPPTWDEGDTAARADSVLAWAQNLSGAESEGKGSPFSENVLRQAFPNTVTREGHPAGYVILTALGKAFYTRFDAAIGRWGLLHEQTAYRFGVIFLWSAALGAVFLRISRSFSRAAALFALFSILCLPRIFTHAQIAFGDSPLMSGWLLAWAFFPRAKRAPFLWLAWGVLLGLTASAKFSGALAPIPFFCWLAVCRQRQSRLPLFFLALLTGLLTFWLLNPPIWHSPLSGIAEYVRLNTHRQAYNIGILFFGKLYSLDRPLPWWNPFFWTAVTIPSGLLISALALPAAAFRSGLKSRRTKSPMNPNNGTDRFFSRRRREEISLLLLNGLPLLLVRTLPGLPVHDGVRLFAAAFPFFGILGGLGLAGLWHRKRFLPRTAALLVLFGSATSLFLYFPQGLSYYNLFIGGLPGAARAGMEVTYYWDGLDREITRAEAPWSPVSSEARPCLFSAASPATLRRWIAWDLVPARSETITSFAGLPDAQRRLSETPFGYYILQNRASGLTPFDCEILRTKKPVWYKTAGRFRTPKFLKNTPWALDRVPLILIYRYKNIFPAPEEGGSPAAE